LIVSVDIYYFSGSGNSLAVARDIARKLKGNLIAIPSVMNQESINSEADVIGLVFPVYYAEYRGIPLIVWRFIEKLEDLGSKYLFAVTTHSGNPASTVEHLVKHLEKRGGKLAGGFTVYMDVPYPVSSKMKKAVLGIELDKDGLIDKLVREQEKAYDAWKDKLETIIEYVSGKQEGKLETPGTFAKILISVSLPLRRLMFAGRYKGLARESKKTFYELVPLADRSFQVNERCNGCGICANVCPVGNIEIADGKPRWLQGCENCFACFKWCPQGAVAGKIVEYATRFRHPEVKLTDFINQRSGG
jgi:Pyruvate/2-oxoacid:ferredoxin oxidoreductase delta subunit/flavodoxin